MSFEFLLTEISDRILTVTINRPDKMNALNGQLLLELEQVFDNAHIDDAIAAVIITGSGQKAFVAGADISEFLSVPDSGRELAEKGHRIFSKIENCPKPVIAAVNGYALGGGCELAMACHLRIAANTARFGQPEINLGIFPGYGGTQRLTQLIGKGRTLELLFTGKMIDAQTALSFGLANAVVSSEELINVSRQWLATITSKAPLALARCIKSVNAVFDHSQDGYAVEATGFGEIFQTEDMKEGVSAFLEKRKPVFKGR